MRKYITIGFLGLLLILSGCATQVELDDYVNISAPFILTSKTINPETGLTESTSETLEVNSEKWKKIIDWGKNKLKGWTSSPASHIGNIYVMQGDFTLIHTRDSKGVVITFIDKQGNPKQYMNVIEKGELSFLYE